MPSARVLTLTTLNKPMTGSRYAAIGGSLMLIKFLSDFLISRLFGHAWSPMVYLRPSTSFGLLAIPEGAARTTGPCSSRQRRSSRLG